MISESDIQYLKLHCTRENCVVGSMIAVPPVLGRLFDDAKKAIEFEGLSVGQISYRIDANIEPNHVIDQNPAPNMAVKPSTAVDLVIAQKVIVVPNTIGLDKIAAEQLIVQSGLGFIESSSSSDSVAPGKVISQNPQPGASAAEGDKVNLMISTGTASTPKQVICTINSTGAYFLDGTNRESIAANLSYDSVKKISTGSLKINAINNKGRYAIQTTSIDAVTIAADGTVDIQGKCTVNNVTGYSFDTTMKDVANPGANKDQFSIKIAGPNNFDVEFLNRTIAGGDIAISYQ